MRFSSALAISAITFLGVSAAPNSPPSYGSDSASGSSGVTTPGNPGTPGTGTTPSGGNNNNNPPSGGEGGNSNNGAGNGCPNEAKSVCCNTVKGATSVDQQLAPPAGGLLSGLLDNLIGSVTLDGLLECGLDGVLGAGNCNHQTICCTAINSPNQSCTAKQGSSLAVNIPIAIGLLGSATVPQPASNA